MYSPYFFNYNITSIFYYTHIDYSLYQKEWDVNVPLLYTVMFAQLIFRLDYLIRSILLCIFLRNLSPVQETVCRIHKVDRLHNNNQKCG